MSIAVEGSVRQVVVALEPRWETKMAPGSASYQVQVFDACVEPQDTELRASEVVNLLAIGLLRRIQNGPTTNVVTSDEHPIEDCDQ